jgi:hypothetical protein
MDRPKAQWASLKDVPISFAAVWRLWRVQPPWRRSSPRSDAGHEVAFESYEGDGGVDALNWLLAHPP